MPASLGNHDCLVLRSHEWQIELEKLCSRPGFGELVRSLTVRDCVRKVSASCEGTRERVTERPRKELRPQVPPTEAKSRLVYLKPWTVLNQVPSLHWNNKVTEDKMDVLG